MTPHARRLLCLLALTLCILSTADGQNNNNQQQQQQASSVFWATAIGYAVLGIIITICCGIISLIAWGVCACHERATKKRRTAHMDMAASAAGLREPPTWSRALVLKPELMAGGFTQRSDGMELIDPCHVIRSRKSDKFTDGARLDVPMTSGKHMFEIIWPWNKRGPHSTVGLGTARASLKCKDRKSLVGNDQKSWGLDIHRRRLVHDGRIFGGVFPPDGSFVPDRFFMYVDLDLGKLGFGVDVTFWGFGLTNLPTDEKNPLFPMVAADKWQADIRVYYKGTADPNLSIAETSFANPHGAPIYPLPPLPPSTSYGMAKPPAYVEVETEPGPSTQHRGGMLPAIAPPGTAPMGQKVRPPPTPATAPQPGLAPPAAPNETVLYNNNNNNNNNSNNNDNNIPPPSAPPPPYSETQQQTPQP